MGSQNDEASPFWTPTKETPLQKLSIFVAAMAALLAGNAHAAVSAYPDNPDIIWRGNFEEGASSLTGHCNCGAVRFEIDEPLAGASYCHCTRCQRRTGTAASANGRLARTGR